MGIGAYESFQYVQEYKEVLDEDFQLNEKTEIIYTGDTMSPVNIDVAILDGNIEKFTVDGKGRNNTDIAMDTKLYSIDSYYVGVFAYFMFPMTILVIVFALLHLIGLSLSPLTLLLIAIPATIIGFHKIGNNYSESMDSSSQIQLIQHDYLRTCRVNSIDFVVRKR